ncbi:MAG: hypothetical protein RQ733_10035 [Methyloprofundus sp.]|nr:hypothetical protein [Methyloprofundus sp.]MDT8426300.1 hypothetical protein [Methyloprofundus sp.]
MMKKIIIIALSFSMFGCAAAIRYQNEATASMTSGAIGCLAKDIKISNQDSSFLTGAQNYVAECNGNKFVCTRYDGSNLNNPATSAQCKPLSANNPT